MKIDPENRSVQGLTVLLHFIAVNILYLLSCLPVITIGAATAALYEVTFRYADDERGEPVRDFFPALLRNLGRASGLAAILLFPAVAALFSGLFWASLATVPAAIAAPIAFVLVAYFFAAFLYAMVLTATRSSTFRQTLRNALLLPAALAARTLGMLLIPVTVVCVSILFPPFLMVVATIAFSVGAYATALLLRPGLSRIAAPE